MSANPGGFVRALACLLVLSTSSPLRVAGGSRGLTRADRAKIEAVLRDYRSAWLANDADAVLRLFSEDTVLMPHHGVEPVIGKRAARAFWFPSEGPPTTVTAFTQNVDEVNGAGDLAYARGHSKVEWTTGTGGEAKRSGNAGTNLTLLRRQADGTWLITVQMWDDPPNKTR